MGEGFWRLLALALVCGVGGHLLPSGEGGAYGKHWKLLCGVCLLVVLLDPLRTLAGGAQGIYDVLRDAVQQAGDESASYDTRQLQEQSIRNLDAALAAEAIRAGVCEQFSMASEDVTLGVRLSEDGQRIEAVNVGLSGAAIWQDSHAIRDWIAQWTDGTVRIYLS